MPLALVQVTPWEYAFADLMNLKMNPKTFPLGVINQDILVLRPLSQLSRQSPSLEQVDNWSSILFSLSARAHSPARLRVHR